MASSALQCCVAQGAWRHSRSRRRSGTAVAGSSGTAPQELQRVRNEEKPVVSIAWEDGRNVLAVRGQQQQRTGMLQATIAALKGLHLEVAQANVEFDDKSAVSIATIRLFIRNGRNEEIVDDKERNAVVDAVTAALTAPKAMSSRLYQLMDQYLKNDVFSIQKSIVEHAEYTLARSRFNFDDFEAYQATAYSVRDRLIERWNDTHFILKHKNPKRVYYLSMEFLMGRSLLNSVFNIGVKDEYAAALKELGFNLEVLVEQERDACLGNGGLGRLAACFLDSLATLEYPAWGYGLRYEYGMFRQTIQDGFQLEHPDYWLTFGNPWEIERIHTTYPVKYYGHVHESKENNKTRYIWTPGEMVEAVAYDNPIPGYGTKHTINLRLWAAKPSGEAELESFNTGDYVNAILNKQRAETISNILYPDDRTYQGKEFRLKQQYFLVSASLQDVVRRFKDSHLDFDAFPEKVAFQLNDTPPVMGIPELIRIFVDEEGVEWKKAWDITTRVFSFTNHLLGDLEKWPVELLENVLPRHMQIINRINYFFMEDLKKNLGSDLFRLSRLSIIEEGEKKSVRMAHLALVTCHIVNGVSEAHTEIIKSSLFKDYFDIWPHKFQSKTNGVTQRRWLACCNPDLSGLISKWLGTSDWVKQLDLLAGLRDHAYNPVLHEEWMKTRRKNKARLGAYIEAISGQKVNVNAMFDVQVKRIHEYKRQLLNVLSIIHRYDCIKNMSPDERKTVVPRVCVIAGKAAPGYENAKRIIKLIHMVGEKVNHDPDVGNLLKLIFIPDYNVSVAELIIPASDLSQHISSPGSEAAGTGNMKFTMNGCLILGSKSGATMEIQKEIGAQNMFLFGPSVDELPESRIRSKEFQPVLEFRRVLGMVRKGYFGKPEYLEPLCDTIDGPGGDYYLLGYDFPSYLEAQAAADKAFVDRQKWAEMSILSTAGSAKFSSDRTIREYAEHIWKVEPLKCGL